MGYEILSGGQAQAAHRHARAMRGVNGPFDSFVKSFVPVAQQIATSPISHQALHTVTHPADDPYLNLAATMYAGPLGPAVLRTAQDTTYGSLSTQQRAQAEHATAEHSVQGTTRRGGR